MTEFENNDSIKLHQPQEVKKALQVLAKAKEIEAKRGKKAKFLKQGESPSFIKLKKEELKQKTKKIKPPKQLYKKEKRWKLEENKETIKRYLREGKKQYHIAKELNIGVSLLSIFIRENHLK